MKIEQKINYSTKTNIPWITINYFELLKTEILIILLFIKQESFQVWFCRTACHEKTPFKKNRQTYFV